MRTGTVDRQTKNKRKAAGSDEHSQLFCMNNQKGNGNGAVSPATVLNADGNIQEMLSILRSVTSTI